MPLFLPPVELTGSTLSPGPDGVNRVFATPSTFEEGSISVFHNGRRLILAPLSGSGADAGEYFVSESGGPGTGFDTVTLVSFTPRTSSELRASYQVS